MILFIIVVRIIIVLWAVFAATLFLVTWWRDRRRPPLPPAPLPDPEPPRPEPGSLAEEMAAILANPSKNDLDVRNRTRREQPSSKRP